MSKGYEYDVIEPLTENFKYIARFINSNIQYKSAFDGFGKKLAEQGIDIMLKINSFKTKEESLNWVKTNLHI